MKSLSFKLLLFLFLSISINIFSQNSSLEFNGVDNHVRSINTYTYITSDVFTIEAWVNIDTQEEAIFASIGWTRIGIGMNANGEFISRTWTGNRNIHNSGYQLETNRWYHLAATFSTGNSTLFINGVQIGSPAPCPIQGGTSDLYIGWGYVINESHFDGKLDEIRMWDDIRTENEILNNRDIEITDPTSEANLIAYYKFNEVSGLLADNAEGSAGYDGLLGGVGFSFDNSSAPPPTYPTIPLSNWAIIGGILLLCITTFYRFKF